MEGHDQPSVKKYSFGKNERIKSRKSIKELFAKGSSFFLYPFKILYLPNSSHANQILIAVSRKSFKRAVHRNTIRRRIREAYRLNKQMLEGCKPGLLLGIVYVGKEILSFSEMERKLKMILQRLNEVYSKKD